MGRIVVLGEPVTVESFALAGAAIVLAEGADAIRRAWAELAPDVAVVVLTASAATVIGDGELAGREGLLTVAMPL